MDYQKKLEQMKPEEIKAAAGEIRQRAECDLATLWCKTTGGSHDFEPISTGIPSLDKALGGGFIRQSVVCLGAAPGMGKTALASQIFESMANAGHDVLYFNLEMSRDAMNARAIVRTMQMDTATAWKPDGAVDILRAYKQDPYGKEREALQDGYGKYGETAKHLWYNPIEKETSDLDEILFTIHLVADAAKKEEKEPPFVCIDYLQLLTTDDPKEDNIAVIKRAMLELKRYANDNDAIVIVITANNRGSMATGESTLNSGRDSSNIEYGADYHLGIEYACTFSSKYKLKDSEKDIGGEKSPTKTIAKEPDSKALTPEMIAALKRIYIHPKEAKTPFSDEQIREMIELEYDGKPWEQVVIRINKDRWNGDGRTARLRFNGAATMFEEIKDPPAQNPPKTAEETKQEERQKKMQKAAEAAQKSFL